MPILPFPPLHPRKGGLGKCWFERGNEREETKQKSTGRVRGVRESHSKVRKLSLSCVQ